MRYSFQHQNIKMTNYDEQFRTKYPGNNVPKFDAARELELGFDRQTEGLTFTQRRRFQERLIWKKYWNIRKKEAEGNPFLKLKYYVNRGVDAPITWFRESIVEPLHDRFRKPYYHRRLDRVPEIDQCGVLDRVCIFEANEQYRFDKHVDSLIMKILYDRLYRCVKFHDRAFLWKCSKLLDEYHENDLNFFIKYGEIGYPTDGVVDAYMKQKHRLIWERRHPEIMAERKRIEEEHKKAVEEGKFDLRFWTRFGSHHVKQNTLPMNIYSHHWKRDKLPFEGDQPISKDWRYYKKLSLDVDFDKRNYAPWLNEATRKAKELEQQKKNESKHEN